jgi:hypothetical protein
MNKPQPDGHDGDGKSGAGKGTPSQARGEDTASVRGRKCIYTSMSKQSGPAFEGVHRALRRAPVGRRRQRTQQRGARRAWA